MIDGMAQRGLVLTYETVRQWCLKFDQQFANDLRRRRPRPGAKWHMDEVFISISREEVQICEDLAKR